MRWVPPEKLHLTLVFLGQTDAHEVARIGAAVEQVAAHSPVFQVATGEGGGRAGGRRGGVAWLRISHGGDEVAQLSVELDKAIGGHADNATTAPRPHLTLARQVTEAALAEAREVAQRIHLAWLVDRVVLLRSLPEPDGSRYEHLAAAGLETAERS